MHTVRDRLRMKYLANILISPTPDRSVVLLPLHFFAVKYGLTER